MKNINEMNFADCLYYVRKKHKDCRTQSLLAVRSRVPRYQIQSFERGESLPTMAQLKAICEVLGSDILRQKGEAAIEYKMTHPEVKICFSDKTTCWRCKGKMCSVYGLVDESPISPDAFNETMLKISREKGVVLEERQSGTTGETHMVNVCPHCGTFIGDFYLHDLWYGETETIAVDDVSDFIRPKEYW